MAWRAPVRLLFWGIDVNDWLLHSQSRFWFSVSTLRWRQSSKTGQKGRISRPKLTLEPFTRGAEINSCFITLNCQKSVSPFTTKSSKGSLQRLTVDRFRQLN